MPVRHKKEWPVGEFGRIVRAHRERLGFTLNELARMIPMDQTGLSKLERGKIRPPQIVPHVHRIAAAFGFVEGSTESKQLVEVAYRERFGPRRPGGIVTITSEGGEIVLTHTPTAPQGLGEYARPETREIIRPDSPLGRQLGLRPEEDVAADRAQPKQDTAAHSFGLAPVLPLFARLPEMLAAFGATITRFNQEDETFNLEFGLPDGREWEMSVSPKSRPPEDVP